MRAVSLVAPRRVELVEMPEPQPGPGEVLLEVGYVGLCGSDLNAYRGTSPMVSYPRVMGHEIGGTVIARGDAVPSEYRVGTKTTLSPYSHCGTCAACLAGRTNSCQHNQTLGVQRDGALCERLVVHHSRLHASDSLSLQELALVEPLSVGYHATEVGRVCAKDQVLVLGCGAVGLGAVAAASVKGARVIGLDLETSKLELARSLGATGAVNGAAADGPEQIAALTGDFGPSVVIEAVGSPTTYRLALDLVAPVGRLVCIGYSDRPVELDTKLIVRKELEVLGSRNALGEFRLVLRMLEARTLPFTRLISRTVPLTAVGEALADWEAAPGAITRILVQVCG